MGIYVINYYLACDFKMILREKRAPILLAGLLAAISASQRAYAAKDLWPMPAYCSGKNKDHWYRVLGKTCLEFGNHYCYAITGLNKYFSNMNGPPSSEHHDLLGQAVKDFDYLENNAGSNCPQQPQIWLAKGRVLSVLQRPVEAAQSFEKAIRRKPSLVPAYFELASLYSQAGQKDVARKILEHGAQANPTNVSIKRRLVELGGQSSDGANKPAKASR